MNSDSKFENNIARFEESLNRSIHQLNTTTLMIIIFLFIYYWNSLNLFFWRVSLCPLYGAKLQWTDVDHKGDALRLIDASIGNTATLRPAAGSKPSKTSDSMPIILPTTDDFHGWKLRCS